MKSPFKAAWRSIQIIHEEMQFPWFCKSLEIPLAFDNASGEDAGRSPRHCVVSGNFFQATSGCSVPGLNA